VVILDNLSLLDSKYPFQRKDGQPAGGVFTLFEDICCRRGLHYLTPGFTVATPTCGGTQAVRRKSKNQFENRLLFNYNYLIIFITNQKG